MTNLIPWLLLIFAGFVVIVAIYKGAHAMAQGEHLGRVVTGLLGGLAIALGGVTLWTRYGGG